jgi:hypothetical protein
MVGADEKTIQNKFGSTHFVRRGTNAQKEIAAILALYSRAGFEVRGCQIMATSDEIISMWPPK